MRDDQMKCLACGSNMGYVDESVSVNVGDAVADFHPTCAMQFVADLSSELSEYMLNNYGQRSEMAERLYVDLAEEDFG